MASRRKTTNEETSPKGRPRARRFWSGDLDALKSAVVALCVEEFRQRFGLDWSSKCAASIGKSQLAENEEQADRVFEQLRQAMRAAVDFVATTTGAHGIVGVLGGRKAHFLAHWAPVHIEPLLQHPSFSGRWDGDWNQSSPIHDNARHRFVASWDTYNHLNLPPRRDGGSRLLNARELAVVWLLSGGWPEKLQFPREGLRAAQVLETEQHTMASVIKAVGRQNRSPELERGPD